MSKRKQPPAAPTPQHDLRFKHPGDSHIGNYIQASYGDRGAIDRLARKGFRMDPQLSSHNQSVFVNGKSKRFVMAVAGTHDVTHTDDVPTDIAFALGGLKETKRYKEARDVLQQARDKYVGYSAPAVVGHSLGGAIASGITRGDELAVTYNKASTLGTTTRGNEQAFRQQGDLVSAMAAGNHNMTTLSTSLSAQAVPIAGPHNVSNLQGTPLFL